MSASPDLHVDDDDRRVMVATDWFMRLRNEDLGQEEMAAWLAWYEGDERNKRAFDDIRAFWNEAGAIMAEDSAHIVHAPATEPRVAPVRRRRWPLALAASVLAGVCVVLPLSSRQQTDDISTLVVEGPQAYGATAPALAKTPEPAAAQLMREAYLPDGSRVALAEKSSVSVEYTRDQRLLVMKQGVAWFSVAHNRERPFIVKVGGINVRAVGTAFNIRHAGERVVVTVSEGKIDVYPDEGGEPLRVEAGKEVTWKRAADPVVMDVDVAHALAWQKGVLDFINEPLASAIADVNRYSHRRIVIRDLALENLLYSGTVFTDATSEWLAALPGLYPLEVIDDGRGDIVLAAKAPAAK